MTGQGAWEKPKTSSTNTGQPNTPPGQWTLGSLKTSITQHGMHMYTQRLMHVYTCVCVYFSIRSRQRPRVALFVFGWNYRLPFIPCSVRRICGTSRQWYVNKGPWVGGGRRRHTHCDQWTALIDSANRGSPWSRTCHILLCTQTLGQNCDVMWHHITCRRQTFWAVVK